MAADGSVIIQIDGDDSGFEKTLNGLKGIATGAVKGIATGAAAATAGVVALGKAALDSYASYEQLVGGVDTLFKDSSATVQQYAAEAYKTAGVSANTYMEQATAFSASLIQSLGGDTQAAAQYANQAIMDMSDNANKMGTNIESIQQTYQSLMRGNYAMLDNLKLGYGGTKSELERLVADAEKLTGQALDPSKFSDVITAIHAVQENLGITGTTALEAATTIEGSMNMAKAAWANMLTGIADDNADFQTLVDNFVTSVETAASNILPRLQIIFAGIGQLVAALAPVIAQAIPTLITNVLPGLVTAAGQMLTAFGSALITNLPLLMTSAAQLVTGFIGYLQISLPQFMTAAGQIIQWIANGIITGLPQLMTSAAGILQNIALGIQTYLPTMLQSGASIISSIIQGFIKDLPQVSAAAGEIIISIVSGIMSSLPELITAAGETITTFINTLTGEIPRILDQGVQLLTTLADGIISAIPELLAQLPQIISAIVEFIISSLPEIIDSGIELLVNFADGIISAIPDLVAQLPEIITAIVTELAAHFPEILESGKQILQSLIDGILSLLSSVGEAMGRVASTIVNKVSELPGKLLEIGRNIIQGLWNGISEKVEWVKSKIRGAVDSIKGVFTGITGFFTGSPSRWSEQVGVWVMQGFGNGFSKDKSAQNAAGKAVEAIKDSISSGIKKGEKDVLHVADRLNDKLLEKEEDLNAELERLDQEDRDRKAAEELADYQQKIKEKYAELEKAEVSERQKIQQEISELEADWNEKQLEAQRDAEREKLEAQLDTLEAFKKEYEDALNEIADSQQSMADKLRDYGELFQTVERNGREYLELGDLQDDIDAINRYGEALENLKARGVSDSLMDEITSMSVDDALAYTDELLDMTDTKYAEYMALWEQKQQAAQQVAEQFYQSEIDTLGREFVDKIPEEFADVRDEMTDIGVQGVQGMIAGMLSQTGALFAAAKSIISGSMDAMRSEADIHSPSRKTANLVGAPLAQGVGVGFDKAYPAVMAKLRRAFDSSMAHTSARLRNMADNAGAFGSRTQYSVQTINRNTTNTMRVVPDGRGIFNLVEEESRRRGKSMISGKGLVT